MSKTNNEEFIITKCPKCGEEGKINKKFKHIYEKKEQIIFCTCCQIEYLIEVDGDSVELVEKR